MMNRREHLAGLGALLWAAMAPSSAQTAYPDKPIHLLVGFPPGQATDAVARLLGERLAQRLGQAVVIENRPGQGGGAVLTHLKQQPADGYTLTMAATGAMITNQYLQKNLPYRVDDFAPIGLVGDLPLMLVARPGAPFDDLKGMVAHARAHPGKLSYASPGNGTTSHLAMESLKKEAGIDIVHVPYQGSVRALTDMMGGMVDVAFDTVAVTQPHVESGRLKLLAVGHARRLPKHPAAPTVAESGYPNLVASVWLGAFAPRQVPPPVLRRLGAALGQVLQEPDTQQKLADLGLIARNLDGEAFARMLQEEGPRWQQIVKASGAQVD